ncbi:GNAT family N-acetyltransferase [Streptomyces sp. CA-250714]|uniref:GNAT family N-acetyltransferase n=1 Tax=Streptomyces sp. CA-250714 TaxID=3240060 RepID=UPI003D91DA6B
MGPVHPRFPEEPAVTADSIELRHATDIDTVWDTLIEVYAEVRADQLHQTHYSVERYGERLARHGSEPGWEAVIGFDGDEPVGYAYVNTIQRDDRWWRRMSTPLPEGCIERSTVALKEIMVRVPWRGTGAARRIHDELLSGRPEEQVSLLVNPLNGNGKVKSLYETWGYREVSTQQPSVDGPVLTAMLRAIREPSPVE